jgi:hypothetical protein
MPWKRMGERMYRSIFSWPRHYFEVSGQLHAPAALHPGKEPPVPIGQEAGWVPEPVWTTWTRENSRTYRDSNSDPSVVLPVASRYTDCAIRAPNFFSKEFKLIGEMYIYFYVENGTNYPTWLFFFPFFSISGRSRNSNYYYYYYYGCTSLCWALAAFSVSWSCTQSVGLLGRGISPSQGLYLYTEQHKHRTNAHNTDIYALSGIRTHDQSVRTSEDSSCLRPSGHCDRPKFELGALKYKPSVLPQTCASSAV